MATSPVEELKALLLQAAALDEVPYGLRGAEKILMMHQLAEASQAVLDYLDGFATEHRTLISLVVPLLEATTPPYPVNGSMPAWTTEVAHGKAPAVRKARTNLIKFMSR